MEKSKIKSNNVSTGMDGVNGAKAGLDYSKINKDPNRKMTQKELETELYDYGMNRKMAGYNTTAADELYDIAGVALTPTRNLINSLFNKGGDKKATMKTTENAIKETDKKAVTTNTEKPKDADKKEPEKGLDLEGFRKYIPALAAVGASLSTPGKFEGGRLNIDGESLRGQADVGGAVGETVLKNQQELDRYNDKLALEKEKLANERLNIFRKGTTDNTGKLNVGGFSPQEAKELVPGLLKKYNLADNKRNKELITSALISGAGDVEGVEVGGIGAWLKPGLQQSDTMKVQLPRNRAITTEF